MSIEMKIFIGIGVALALIAAAVLYKYVPKKLKRDRFTDRWKKLQECLKDKGKWAEAVIAADKLLDEALRKRKFKGGSMGERMVSAQRYFTNNDDLWFAHNLCKKLKANNELKLREDDVKDALVGFRQALRDLGALDNGQSRET